MARYEARELDCTDEQFQRLAYGDPGPSDSWPKYVEMSEEEKALAERVRTNAANFNYGRRERHG